MWKGHSHFDGSGPLTWGPAQSRSGGVGGVPPISPPPVPGVGHWPTGPASQEGKSEVEGVLLNLTRLRCASPMGKARFELARISPRDPKSRSSAHSDTSPSLWTLYYQRPILANGGQPKRRLSRPKAVSKRDWTEPLTQIRKSPGCYLRCL